MTLCAIIYIAILLQTDPGKQINTRKAILLQASK